MEPQAQLQIAQVARRPTHPQHPHLHQVRPTGLVVSQMPPVLGLRRSPSRVELQAQPESLQRARPEHCQQAGLREVLTMKLAACQMPPVPEPQRGLSVAESRTQSNLQAQHLQREELPPPPLLLLLEKHPRPQAEAAQAQIHT